MAHRLEGLLVAGGRHHDFDFIRVELLTRMAANPAVHTTVSPDFSDVEALSSADFLVSYTCEVRPTAKEAQALRNFVSEGGRWLALHSTNAIADLNADGSGYFELLGTKFIAHPSIREFDVSARQDASHPVLGNIRGFRTRDEIYLVERTTNIDVLLETTYVGPTTGVPEHWGDESPLPVLYVRRLGRGSVLYLTLGHASGRGAAVERCSWDVPEFLEILERAFEWAWSG